MAEFKKATLEQIIKKKLDKDDKRNATKEIYIESLGGSLTFNNPSDSMRVEYSERVKSESYVDMINAMTKMICVPVLTKYFTKWLKAKTEATQWEQIGEIVASAVEETNQTYVDSLKASGSFDEVAQVTALNASLTTAVSLLSEDMKALILGCCDSLESYITVMIESYIKISKE